MSELKFNTGDWAWSQSYQQLAKIIESSALWNANYYRIWLQQQDTIVKVPVDDLISPEEKQDISAHFITYLTIAAKVSNAQQEDVLLAPIESNVIPLPHQLKALNKAMSRKQLRYLFADEVGLGKTIEAGLVMRELKLRGLASRILVVAPKGLVTQWVSEMSTHFNENFKLILPGDYKNLEETDNIWSKHNQVVCPVDSIKPIEKRKGWSLKRLHQYNKIRFDDLLAVGWDLIVIDEAHRLGGSTDQVARYKLGQGLAEATPYLLLLTATPHQGKSDAFHRLMALLDPESFPDMDSITKERVQQFVVRTEKRISIDGEGKPLFKPRTTEMIAVTWGSKHVIQEQLYEEVTEYIKTGYNKAKAEKQNAIGFLMILMQRLVSSSSAAIAKTLERRLDVLKNAEVVPIQMELPDNARQVVGNDILDIIDPDILEWNNEFLDTDEDSTVLENGVLEAKNQEALDCEISEVEFLLSLARRCVANENDTKAEALFELVYKIQQEESNPELKVLIFTEFVPTQAMLMKFLEDRGMSVVCLNGSMDLDERRIVQRRFSEDVRILISTDAGGEGLNLQFCHVIVNYDIPWNPMRLEQRIGRVDRIGQEHQVKAINLVLEGTVEHRVREVLEKKLDIILHEFGVDKAGDVLDSAEANHLFDELFIESLANPELIDQELAKALETIQEAAVDKKQQDSLFDEGESLKAEDFDHITNHPLPHWVGLMVECYLLWQKESGQLTEISDDVVGEQKVGKKIRWPDGEEWHRITFSGKEAQMNPKLKHITLQNSKIRGLCNQLSVWSEVQDIPQLNISGLPKGAGGFWSLWGIRLGGQDERQISYFPLYCKENGQFSAPASQRIWDAVSGTVPEVVGFNVMNNQTIYKMIHSLAEEQGKSIFEAMEHEYQQELLTQEEKSNFAFSARKKAINRIGLSEVKNYRLRQLDKEYSDWTDQLKRRKNYFPELSLHLLFEVKG